jgi:hypothetical protein
MFHGIHVLTLARRKIPLVDYDGKGKEYVNIVYMPAIHSYVSHVTFVGEMIQKSFSMLHYLISRHFQRQNVRLKEYNFNTE